MLTDPALAAALRQVGPPQAAGFTWTATARATAAIYERLAGVGQGRLRA